MTGDTLTGVTARRLRRIAKMHELRARGRVTHQQVVTLAADERERIAVALMDLGYDYPAEVARNGGPR